MSFSINKQNTMIEEDESDQEGPLTQRTYNSEIKIESSKEREIQYQLIDTAQTEGNLTEIDKKEKMKIEILNFEKEF